MISINNYDSLFKDAGNTRLCPDRGFYQTNDAGFFTIEKLQTLKPLKKKTLHGTVRRSFYTIVLVTKGKMEETVNHTKYEISPGTLYFIPANVPATIHQWSDDIEGYHCVFDADYFLLCEKNQVRLNSFEFFNGNKQPFVSLSSNELSDITNSLDSITTEFCKSKQSGNDLLVKLYLNALLTKIERIYSEVVDNSIVDLSRKNQIVANFRKLVSIHAGKLSTVSSFAKMLNITPHYLNDTVRDVTGTTASLMIQTEIISLAKSYLVQTDLTVLEISSALHFTDHSYFSRFFKKHVGMTPLQFRESHNIC